MAGIYFHIPFCLSKCNYCDFYSETKSLPSADFINCLQKELLLRTDYLQDKVIKTVYFGGGTPSLLQPSDIERIISTIQMVFTLLPDSEITLEANPEDLSTDYLEKLAETSVNRLSIGIQSFDDRVLKFLNRRHNAKRAFQAVNSAKEFGFHNISGDLIYSIPGFNGEDWKYSLDCFFDLEIPHLSAYDLIYEEGTKLFKQLKKNIIEAETDDKCEENFTLLVGEASKRGYSHYELSNFAKSGYESMHNSAYWQAVPYLGIGPSAHSYNGISRQWNIDNVGRWQKAVKSGKPIFQVEQLTKKDIYNELIITGIRTAKGVSLEQIENKTSERYVENLKKEVEKNKTLIIDKNHVFLKKKYWFVSDSIISDMILIKDL